MKESIYVSIPSADEEFLELTITSALQNAYDPSRVTFGIFQHCIKKNPIDFSQYGDQVLTSSFYCKNRINVGFARMSALLLNKNPQNYYLQCDGHMIFLKDWDKKLIDSYKDLLKFCEKPIISGRTAWWYKSSNGSILAKDINNNDVDPFFKKNKFHNMLPMDIKSQKIYKNSPNTNWNLDDCVSNLAESIAVNFNKNSDDFCQHFLTCGNLFFCNFSYMKELIPDPYVLFAQDELLHALRAVTRGYSIYSIPQSIALHQNKFGTFGQDYIDKIFEIDSITERYDYIISHLDPSDWRKNISKDTAVNNPLIHNVDSHMRCKKILTGEYLGFWGAPNKKALRNYEDLLGFNFLEYFKDF